MGELNLTKLVSGVLFGFFLFAVFMSGATKMGQSYGIGISENGTFALNGSITTGENIEKAIQDKGVDSSATFFPAIGTLFQMWGLIKASAKDLTQAMQTFAIKLGGDPLLGTLLTIISVSIMLTIAFIILAALFRQGGFRLQ